MSLAGRSGRLLAPGLLDQRETQSAAQWPQQSVEGLLRRVVARIDGAKDIRTGHAGPRRELLHPRGSNDLSQCLLQGNPPVNSGDQKLAGKRRTLQIPSQAFVPIPTALCPVITSKNSVQDCLAVRMSYSLHIHITSDMYGQLPPKKSAGFDMSAVKPYHSSTPSSSATRAMCSLWGSGPAGRSWRLFPWPSRAACGRPRPNTPARRASGSPRECRCRAGRPACRLSHHQDARPGDSWRVGQAR